MDFNVYAQQNVVRPERAGLGLSLSTDAGRNLFSVSLSGRSHSSVIELPEMFLSTNAVATLTLKATFGEAQRVATMGGAFRKRRSHNVEASVRIPINLLLSINIVQNRANYVQASVDHKERSVMNAPDQCVVTCPKTGKSLTGRNVCIECECSRGTVKICC